MKNIFFIAAAALMFTACEDFLDTESYTQKNTDNYPSTVEEANQVITGIYNNLNVVSADPQYSFLYYSELASDDRLGGGGGNDNMMQAHDLLMNYNEDMTRTYWKARYQGIFRANTAIETLGNCTGYQSEDQKNQIIGEAYFMRAFFYYELASMYENVPLILLSASESNPSQNSPDEIWSQIMSDLVTAIELMPARPYNSGFIKEGHVDRWCAEALLGRSYLFYTGFYNKTDVTLPDGTVLTKDVVANYIDDCVNNSGYSLVSDFRNLWAYSNKYTVEDYYYTKGQGLKWVEDDKGINQESMFSIKYSTLASWNTTIGYANGYALHFGVRGGQDYGNTFPFGQGWGAGPVAPNLVDDWKSQEPNDPRMWASIQVLDELPAYEKGGWADWVQETDYYNKKGSSVSAAKNRDEDGNITEYWSCFENPMYDPGLEWPNSNSDNFQLNNIHDLVLIRFAEVLLLQSELKQSAEGINKVRERSGLAPIAGYSLEALQRERRWELCFEGVRWNDIRRWGIAEQALERQTNVAVYYCGQPSKNVRQGDGYAARYTASRGFAKIPESQVTLSDGVLKQNKGWEGNTGKYISWTE